MRRGAVLPGRLDRALAKRCGAAAAALALAVPAALFGMEGFVVLSLAALLGLVVAMAARALFAARRRPARLGALSGTLAVAIGLPLLVVPTWALFLTVPFALAFAAPRWRMVGAIALLTCAVPFVGVLVAPFTSAAGALGLVAGRLADRHPSSSAASSPGSATGR